MIAVIQSAASMRAGFKARRVSIIRSAITDIGWPPAHQARAMLGRLATRSRQNFKLSSPAATSIFAMAT
jgi:hypothetical protein